MWQINKYKYKSDDFTVRSPKFCFGVVVGLSKNFTGRGPKCRCIKTTIRLPENNDSEACDNALEIGYIFGQNSFK